jgi:SecD/SecF fusion protein
MFTALYVTRTLFLWGMEKGILTEFRMMPVLLKAEWKWMGQRRRFFGASIALIVAGTIVFAVRPAQDKYDLEFTGGQRVIIALKAKMSLPEVRKAIEEGKLGDVGVRTIRGRGSSSENLDLATESDSFELTARIKDEAEGAQFTDRAKKAFGALLAPPSFTEFRLEPKGADGSIPFHFVVNLATKAATAEGVKKAIEKAPAMASARDLKVEHTPAYPGAESFIVAGKVAAVEGKDPELIIEEQIAKAIHDNPEFDLSEPIPQSDFIGPGVARTLRDQAMLAVLLSILAQIVYLRLRFRDFTYGVAAAIALVHDVLITLGAVAVVDWLGIAHLKINLPVIASFLTLIGYSMNDTIVVFDRIRENLGRSTHPGSGLIDGSINQTIARSIRTSMTVWLVAVVLFLFNLGAASSLEGFAFVMVIGVLTGTYSSVAIASPLLLFLPLYGASLRKLGRPVQVGLFAALGIGLLLAMATDGASAVFGGFLAAVLPAHFLWGLLRWLPEKDPDALVRGLEGTQPAGR